MRQVQSNQLRADVILCNTIAATCAVAQQWRWAVNLAELLPQCQLPKSETTYTALLTAERRWKEAVITLSNVWSSRATPSSPILGAAIRSCCLALQWSVALPLLELLTLGTGHLEEVFPAYEVLLTACGRAAAVRTPQPRIHDLRRVFLERLRAFKGCSNKKHFLANR